MKRSGKITPQILRNFEVEFRECICELPHLGKEEIGENLRSKLLDYMTQWIVEREKDLDRNFPVLHLRFPITTYTPAQVQVAIQGLSGVIIKKISALDTGFYEIHCHTNEDAKKIRNLSGRYVARNPSPIMVVVKEHVLGVNEVFEVLRDKVDIKQRVAETNALKI